MLWYYLSNEGETRGPLDSSDLRELVASEEILPTTQIRSGLEGDWFLASRIRGLFETVPKRSTLHRLGLVALVIGFSAVSGGIAFVLGHRAGKAEDRTKFAQSEERGTLASNRADLFCRKVGQLEKDIESQKSTAEQLAKERDDAITEVKNLRKTLTEKAGELERVQEDYLATNAALKQTKAELSKAITAIAEIDKAEKADTQRTKKARAALSDIAEQNLKEYGLLVNGDSKRHFVAALTFLKDVNQDISSGNKSISFPTWVTTRSSAFDARKRMIVKILDLGGNFIPEGSTMTLDESWAKALKDNVK